LYDPEKAKLYRAQATELLGWAEKASSNEERRHLLAIAVTYHWLAKYFEDDGYRE
jgi:hypothetical protein